MKLSKEELKRKIDEKIVDEEIKIELLEDIEDSVDVVDNSEIETKYNELLKKYKERFLSNDNETETETETDENSEEYSEEEVIDIKEI